MSDQRILSTEEFNQIMREQAAERNKPPVCSCTNQGEPYDLHGVMVVSRDPACRVHNGAGR